MAVRLIRESVNEPFKSYSGYKWEDLNIPKDRYVIDTKWFYQYAEGVTGQTFRRTIITTPEGFKTKTEAKQFMKSIGLKPYHKKGRKDYGYGSVGEESLSVDITLAENIRNSVSRYDYIKEVHVYDEQGDKGDLL